MTDLLTARSAHRSCQYWSMRVQGTGDRRKGGMAGLGWALWERGEASPGKAGRGGGAWW